MKFGVTRSERRVPAARGGRGLTRSAHSLSLLHISEAVQWSCCLVCQTHTGRQAVCGAVWKYTSQQPEPRGGRWEEAERESPHSLFDSRERRREGAARTGPMSTVGRCFNGLIQTGASFIVFFCRRSGSERQHL